METKTFNHEIFGELRTVVMPDGQIGFVGRDVARALVQIRQTGSYSSLDGEESEIISMLRKTIDRLMTSCEAKEELIAAQRPKVEYANVVGVDTDLCTLADLAKLICNAGVPIGQNRLCEWMREHHYLCRSRQQWNTPRQEWVDEGLLVAKVYKRPWRQHGYTYAVMPMVTAKGQEFFIEQFLNKQLAA